MKTTDLPADVTMVRAAEVMAQLLKAVRRAKLPAVCAATVEFYRVSGTEVRMQLACPAGMGNAEPDVADPIRWAAVHAWARYLESPLLLKEPTGSHRVACVETEIDGIPVRVWDHLDAEFVRPEKVGAR